MPHNPRRTRDRDPIAEVLTDEQIGEAMARAVELRQRCILDPACASPQPMPAWDAMMFTRGYRRHSWDYRTEHTGPDPWWWIGWVHEPVGDDRRTWEVWLDVQEGRVWLKRARR
jgi:hypothetical protein